MNRHERPAQPASSPLPRVQIDVRNGGDPARATELAAQLGLPLRRAGRATPDLVLAVTPERLELHVAAGRRQPVAAEFVGGAFGRRLLAAGRRNELLARAVGLGAGTATVLDATAGLGGDSVLLAWLGARVTAVERQPVVAALLQDAVRRARLDPRLGPALAARLTVVAGDARARLDEPGVEPPDAVLIDPMFPQAGRTALGRGALQILRELVGADEDATGLLERALAVARRRVVVKRPAHAEPLGGRAPQLRLTGASTRFDVYLVAPAR